MAQRVNNWKAQVLALQANNQLDDVDRIVSIMHGNTTKHAGTAPAIVKSHLIEVLQKATLDDPVEGFRLGHKLILTNNPSAKEVGICLVGKNYNTNPTGVLELFEQVGNDENWEVREWAASGLTHVIVDHHESVLAKLEVWSASPSANLRRMVVVASGYAMRDNTRSEAHALLELMEPLMADRDPYVSKNLGPFALGSYAIRWHPEIVAQWLDTLDLAEEQVAWNVAISFASAPFSSTVDCFLNLFLALLVDERKRIKTAIQKALRKLRLRVPDTDKVLLAACATPADRKTIQALLNTLR